jgi:hypothetical protein
VATHDAFDTKPSAFENAIFEHRFYHVLATGGRIATGGRRERRYTIPVEIYRQEKDLSYNRFDAHT